MFLFGRSLPKEMASFPRSHGGTLIDDIYYIPTACGVGLGELGKVPVFSHITQPFNSVFYPWEGSAVLICHHTISLLVFKFNILNEFIQYVQYVLLCLASFTQHNVF